MFERSINVGVIEIIELIGIIISFVFGLISLIVSIKANSFSKNANKISEKSLKLSEELHSIHPAHTLFPDIPVQK